MLKKIGLSLLVSLGALSAAETQIPEADSDYPVSASPQREKEAGSVIVSAAATQSTVEEVENSDYPVSASPKRERAAEEPSSTDLVDSDGEQKAAKGPRLEAVFQETQLPASQLPETLLTETQSDTSGDTIVVHVEATQAPAIPSTESDEEKSEEESKKSEESDEEDSEASDEEKEEESQE